MINIREAKSQDWDQIWPILEKILRSGETYAFATDMSEQEAKQVWIDIPHKTLVAEEEGVILGSYFLKANFGGNASHVANCGYMVSELARGKGIATLMCEHSQQLALELGYLAMQFNFVVSTNESAVRLWHKLGFNTVGRIPKAFKHPKHGFVDSLVMFKWLSQ